MLTLQKLQRVGVKSRVGYLVFLKSWVINKAAAA